MDAAIRQCQRSHAGLLTPLEDLLTWILTHLHDSAGLDEAVVAEEHDASRAVNVVSSLLSPEQRPAYVADVRAGDVVGRDRVMAGSDCGFSTFAGFGAVDPEIVWAKLKALSDGAAIARP